jgi:hypothetical protein
MNIAGLRSIGSAMLLVLLAGCPLCEQLFIDSWANGKYRIPLTNPFLNQLVVHEIWSGG